MLYYRIATLDQKPVGETEDSAETLETPETGIGPCLPITYPTIRHVNPT